jgi:hypothetical protein
MKKYEGRIAGILGTIIIHLVAALLFMSVKLHSLYQEKKSEFLIEFQSDDRFIEDEVVEVPRTLEEIFRDDDRYMDIVRNIANQPEVEIATMILITTIPLSGHLYTGIGRRIWCLPARL